MSKTIIKRKPRQSLSTLLLSLFIMFSVVPIGFLTGFSFVKYEQAIDGELEQRLLGNAKEAESIFRDFEVSLSEGSLELGKNSSLAYFLSTQSLFKLEDLVKKWMQNQLASRGSIFDRDGRMLVSFLRKPDGSLESEIKLSESEVFLSETTIGRLKNNQQIKLVDIISTSLLELIVYTRVLNKKGDILGYIEELITLDKDFLLNLKKRMNLEIFFLNSNAQPIASTLEDILLYSDVFFKELISSGSPQLREVIVQEIPIGLILYPLKWGEGKIFLGIGAGKQDSKRILKEVKYAFFSVVGVVILLLSVVSLATSKIISKPLRQLLEAIQIMENGEKVPELKVQSSTELGLVAESFNRMSQKILQTQKELKEKIVELESAYTELQKTQSQLIHSEKMASLGQLVAGVAHELNNPIGYIYSNMSHLKEYSQKLFEIINIAQQKPKQLNERLNELEYNYILEDLPRLIESCEKGAHRIRDIVIGLRNFSRLDEAKLEEADIEKAIEDTLVLLSGELKGRIKVHKQFAKIPFVFCYLSQLNQVFMNILSNAAGAISGEGDIWISTEMIDRNEKVKISIRDNGRGMSSDELGKIFDPFFTTKEVGQGTGLGLSISYGIIKRHNGEILVSSVKDKGSDFSIILPLKSGSHSIKS